MSQAINTIGTETIRKKMGEVLDSVYFRGDEYIIERKSKQLAALISIDKYNNLKHLARQLVLNNLSSVNNKDLSDEEVNDLANEAKHLVRKND